MDERTPIDQAEAKRVLKARREHDQGDGNFPTPEPRAALDDERPEDRTPRDLPKGQDDRSAPKGDVRSDQRDRNPALEMRDDHKADPPAARSGFEDAVRAADAMAGAKGGERARPTARRSSSAKRKAQRGR